MFTTILLSVLLAALLIMSLTTIGRLFFVVVNLICCVCFASENSSPKPQLLLANVYQQTGDINVQDYWVSEKYDGVRAYWNGHKLLSRAGNTIQAPAWFVEDFPSYAMDGELWLGRQQFDEASGIVRTHQPDDDDWRKIQYMIFDLPASSETFDVRKETIENELKRLNIAWLVAVPQFKVVDDQELLSRLDHYIAEGAEGLMLHRGSSYYEGKRSNDLLKLKPALDSEAIVLSYTEGKGKYTGKVGALEVEWLHHGAKKRFRIGSGLSDADRETPPVIGARITFQYSGLTSKGLPRFARFIRIRPSY